MTVANENASAGVSAAERKPISTAGWIAIGALLVIGVYALARCVDEIDRLRYLDQVRTHVFSRQIANGQTTLAAVLAKGKALDHRNGLFVGASWVLSLVGIVAYRNWRMHVSPRPLTPAIRLMQKSATVLWIVALGAQFLRMASASGTSLSAAHTDVLINLASRALILPAVVLSILLIQFHEATES